MIIFFSLILFIGAHASEHSNKNIITFDEAFQKMMTNDFAKRLGNDNVDRVEAQKLEAYAQFLPSLYVRANSNRDTRFIESTRTFNTTAKLGLWRNGVDFLGIKEQKLNLESASSGATFENFRAETRVTKVLFEYIWRSQVLVIKRTIAEARRELVELTKSRYRQGLVPEPQVLAVELDSENAESQLTFTTQDLQDSRAEIERSLGPINSEDTYKENSALPQSLNQTWPYLEFFSGQKIKELLGKASDKDLRPDYQKYRAASEASEIDVVRAKASFLPIIDFQVERNRLLYSHYGINNSRYETTFALTLTAPLFENLNDYVVYKQSAYNRSAAQYQLLEFNQKFDADFRAKKLTLERGLERLKTREMILAKGERLFRVMKKNYQTGRLNYQELALEQERYFNSSLNYQQGLLELHNSLVDYCHALGFSLVGCL